MTLLWLLTAWAAPFDTVDAATTTSAKADALMELTEAEDTSAEAWRRLAEALTTEAKIPLAVLAYAKAFDADPDLEGADTALQLADSIGDAAVIALSLRDRKTALGEGDTQSDNAVLIARALLRAGHLSETEAWLKRVDGDAPAFADAESLRGIVLASKGKNAAALAPLQTARALGKTLNKGDRFDEKLLMNIARAYYGDKNFGQAIYHYSLVPRDSTYWAEARFEKAWAHFRANDVPGAVAELQTHQSPFFDELWFPEAWMLRAQSLFVMCRYGAAVKAMDAYEERFQPVLTDLGRTLGSFDANAAFDAVDAYLDGEPQPLPEMVLRPYRQEDRIEEAREAIDAYRAAAKDTSSLGEHGADFGKMATARADLLKKTEGERIFERVERQKRELADMIAGLELARIDILDRESRMYERAAATGVLERPDRKAQLKKISREKKGYRVWPFEGEYWVDELGWYQITALSACPETKAK